MAAARTETGECEKGEECGRERVGCAVRRAGGWWSGEDVGV